METEMEKDQHLLAADFANPVKKPPSAHSENNLFTQDRSLVHGSTHVHAFGSAHTHVPSAPHMCMLSGAHYKLTHAQLNLGST